VRGRIRSLWGYYRLWFERKDAAEVIELCRRDGILYWDATFSEESFYLCVYPTGAKKLRLRFAYEKISPTKEEKGGLPCLLGRLRHRYGLMLGSVLFCAILYFSTQVIWDIRVEGNERLSEETVIAELRECGLHIGSVKKALDVDSLQNRVLILSDDISWISVNLMGTVAQVEIREVEPLESSPEEEYVAANLVATQDGQIELFEDVRGNVVCRIGDVVRQGELLVSGVYDSATMGMRYTRASGKVIARTEREFSVDIPLQFEKKVYTGRVFVEKYLVFFEKEIKFFGNTGNLPPKCDTINTVEYAESFTGDRLPVGVRTVRYLEYTYESAERSEEEALSLAQYRLRCDAAEVMAQGELVAKRTEHSLAEGVLTLRYKMEILENIACVRQIIIDPIPH